MFLKLYNFQNLKN